MSESLELTNWGRKNRDSIEPPGHCWGDSITKSKGNKEGRVQDNMLAPHASSKNWRRGGQKNGGVGPFEMKKRLKEENEVGGGQPAHQSETRTKSRGTRCLS